MKKSIIKAMIGGAAALSLTLGTIITTFGATADQLYSSAYNATQTAMNTKTQIAINNARTAIVALKGTGAEWAIGEFSKQVDQVQQPILVSFINAYDKAKGDLEKITKDPSLIAIKRTKGVSVQLSIEEARKALDPNLPKEWLDSYSSALDKVQQDYGQEAFTLNDIAIKSNKGELSNGEYSGQEHVQAGTILGDIINNSSNPDLVRWAKIITNQISNVHVFDV